ncbi:hypothetical protein HJO_00575 [Hyphomonas johnsonii MHS-2]|uniref:Uncharacterized protein n=2 Tax=Hyphomonas johnsonii TaxID=81031 RepID=A0A059FT03_9PROT|nr:hypothetical protein HJO_00575 [Hyphomonas johnsonii MHS-2]
MGLAMAAPIMSAMLPGGKPIEALANVFSVAHGQAEQSIQTSLVRQVWAGVIDPSQLSIRVNGADAAALMAQVQASEAKRASENHMFLITLSQLNDAIDEMEARADEMERSFVEKYGESWREDLALKILDEDEIPQRMDGESLADYRERVEQALIEEMIDENGEIKDQYKNDPELKDRAEWAKTRWDTRQAKLKAEGLEATYNDPNATDVERQEALEDASQAGVRLAKHNAADEDIAAEMDAEMDKRLDEVSSTKEVAVENSFLSMTGQS